MNKSRKYQTSHLIEAQHESGSRGRVLKNFLGIKRKREMDRLEKQEYFEALHEILRLYGLEHRFASSDICRMHKIWLGEIYSWAGEYRSVNISKGGFSFAMAREIPKLMVEFEETVLAKYTPCRYKVLSEIAEALAVVHVEFVLIHPFREGNGRIARLLAMMMAFQAGLPALDFGGIRGKKKDEYIVAVQSGLRRNYIPMQRIFLSVIKRTIKKATSTVS